jgi:C_GCAxxG_C_C family probable redox protein
MILHQKEVKYMISEDEIRKEIHPYFGGGKLNCAESTMTALRNFNVIDAPESAVRMMTGFGGGMQRGLICGAVIAGAAALGYITGRTSPGEDREPSAEAVSEYLDRFKEQFGSLYCARLSRGFESKSDEMYEHCTGIAAGAISILTDIIDGIEVREK